MSNKRYPPRGDSEILEAADQFITNSTSATANGLTAAEATRLTSERDAAQTDYDDYLTAQAAAQAARAAKDNSLETVSKSLSEFNRRLQPNPSMTDQDREKLGIPIYDKTATSAGAPNELPVIKIDTSMPLSHTIYFADADGKGKPEGVKALEIHVKIGGDATGSVKDYDFLAQDTESPYTKAFDITDAGKQAHYMCCWVNSKGERGAFEMESATITSDLQTGRV